jgi:arabinogalactan oligomer / maltooligosaccharide transport system permease protein
MHLKSKALLKKRTANVVAYLILIIFSVIAVYPILQVVSISLRPSDRLLSTSLAIIPEDWTLNAFKELFTERPFLLWMRNSILIAFVVTSTGVILAALAGYAFSRFRFRGRNAGLLSLLVTQMFPATMLLLPMYIMLVKLGLINTFLGVIIIYSSTALPFCIWTMKGYYDTISPSLEEAARIDGCSQFTAFYKVVLPLAAPALVIVALFSFMTAWAEYVVAAQVLQDTGLWTLPVGLQTFQANMSSEWGLYAAASLIVSIPVVIMFLALSRFLVSGLTLGSVKG